YETLMQSPVEGSNFTVEVHSDRRADVEAKQVRVATLLREHGKEGLLLLDPENVAWLTSGASSRGVRDPAQEAGGYCTAEGRWLRATNADTQRLFDEEVDGLGFQLKEWPWHLRREQFLTDLCHNRKLLCDRPPGCDGDFTPVEPALRKLRRVMTPYEQACL